MEYNKRRFQKTNDKKVLHKVKKNWVVMSMALLMAIGGEAAVTHVSAHADTNNNNNGSNDSTNTIRERLNQQLIQGQKQAQAAQNQNNNQTAQSSQSSQASQNPISTKQIGQQASALHEQIMSNAVSNGAKHGLLGQGRVAQPSNNQNKSISGQSKVAAPQASTNSQSKNQNVNQNVRKDNLLNTNHKRLLGDDDENDHSNLKDTGEMVGDHFEVKGDMYGEPPAGKLWNTPDVSGLDTNPNDKIIVYGRWGIGPNAAYWEYHSDGHHDREGVLNIHDGIITNGNIITSDGNGNGTVSNNNYETHIRETGTNGSDFGEYANPFWGGRASSDPDDNDPSDSRQRDILNNCSLTPITSDDGTIFGKYVGGYLPSSDVANLKTINVVNVKAPQNCIGLFVPYVKNPYDKNYPKGWGWGMPSLTNINFKDFDTSNVDDMADMFADDALLDRIRGLNSFNTSKVSDMTYMFMNFYQNMGTTNGNLESLDLRSFDTTKAANANKMSNMFGGQKELDFIALGPNTDISKTNLMGDNNGTFNTSFQNDSYGYKVIETPNKEQAPNKYYYLNSDRNFPTDTGKGSDYYKQNHTSDGYGPYFPKPSDPSDDIVNPTVELVSDYNGVTTPVKTASDKPYIRIYGIKGDTIIPSIQLSDKYLPTGFEYVPNGKTKEFNTETSDWQVPVEHIKYPYFNIYYTPSDGMIDPSDDVYNHSTKLYTNPAYPLTQAPNGWALVNADGTLSPNKANEDSYHRIMVAPEYDGMTYKYNTTDHSVTFINGTPQADLSNFMADAPDAIKNAKTIDFGSNFDTSHVTNMSNMFNGAANLQTIIIDSPNTKFNSSANVPEMYQQANTVDNNTHNYTSPKANDFSSGTTGTFTTHYNPQSATVTINYMNNGALVAHPQCTFKFNGSMYDQQTTSINWNNSNLYIPSYWVPTTASSTTTDNGPSFVLDPRKSSFNVNVIPQKITINVNYMHNGSQVGSATYSGNNFNANQDKGQASVSNTGITLKSNNSSIMANYHPASDHTINFTSDNTYTVNVAPDTDLETINYMYKDKGSDVPEGASRISGPYGSNAKSAIDQNEPANYHVVSGDDVNYSPNAQLNVYVDPDLETDRIDYVDDSDHGASISSDVVKGIYGSRIYSDITSNVPNKYTIVNSNAYSNDTFSPKSNGNDYTYDVDVTAKPVTAYVQFRDIYENTDDGVLGIPSDKYETGKPSDSYTIKSSDLTSFDEYGNTIHWALVNNSNGTMINGNDIHNDNESFAYGDSSNNPVNHTLFVAPVYDGLVYKYDRSHNHIYFIRGTADIPSASDNFSDTDFTSDSDVTPSITSTPISRANNRSIEGPQFGDINHVANVTFGSDVDMSKLSNMNLLFANNSNLKTLDLSRLNDTHQPADITSMAGMFMGDTNLTSLTLPKNLDTSKVTDMTAMFNSDKNLSQLTWPKTESDQPFFDTANVNHMSEMFNKVGLTGTLTLPKGFDTTNVKDMQNMFSGSNLSNVVLGNQFNTSQVSDMAYMFAGMPNMSDIELPVGFDTRHVNNMVGIFGSVGRSDYNPKTMPKSDKDISTNLKKLTTNSSDTTFFGKTISTNVGPKLFGTGLLNMYELPDQTNAPKDSQGNYYTSAFANDFTKGQSGKHTFVWLFNVGYSDVYKTANSDTDHVQSDVETGTVTNNTIHLSIPHVSDPPVGYAFVNANNDVVTSPQQKGSSDYRIMVVPDDDGLVYKYNTQNNSVNFLKGTANSDLSKFTTITNQPGVPEAKTMTFSNNVDMSNATNMSGMFSGAEGLSKLDLGNHFDTSNVNNMGSMFAGLSDLKTLSLPSDFVTEDDPNEYNMFGGISYNGKPSHYTSLDTLKINSSDTKLTNASLSDMYQQYASHDNHNKYTSPTPNHFSDGNIGTFVKQGYDAYSDIYKGIDGNYDGDFAPASKYFSNGNAPLPSGKSDIGYAFVNADGSISQTPHVDKNDKVMVAPTWLGLTFKYNPNNGGSIEFVNGKPANNGLEYMLNVIGMPSWLKNITHIKFDGGVDTSLMNNMAYMFYGAPKLQTIDFGPSFDTSNVTSTNMNEMFGNVNNLRSITVQSPKTKFNATDDLTTKLYKQLPQKDNQGNYTAATPNDFSQGNLGTFVKQAHLTYSDVYDANGNVDDLGGTLNSDVTMSPSDVPAGWCFVNSDGEPSKDASGNPLPLTNANGKVMVAPEYMGMTFRYDAAHHSIEFMYGKADQSKQNDRQLIPAAVQSLKKITFGDGADISDFGSLSQIITATNYPNLHTIVIASDTKTPSVQNRVQGWVNLSASDPIAGSTHVEPGVWTNNAEVLDYQLNGQTIGHDLVLDNYGDTFSLGSHPSGLDDRYKVVPNTAFDNIKIDGDNDLPVAVEDNTPISVSLPVTIEYEVKGPSDKPITATTNVEITGLNNSTVYYDPTNLIAPSGYQLDQSSDKTQQSYAVNLASDNSNWAKGTPIIYFKGDQANDSVVVNQVVKSQSQPKGTIVKVLQQTDTINNHVGDSYTVKPSDVQVPMQMDASSQPDDYDNRQSATGLVFEHDGVSYLSKPSVTFYYTDPSAQSTITIDYVDNNNDRVSSKSFTKSIGDSLSSADYASSANLPAGYSCTDKAAVFKYGDTDQDYTVPVKGNPVTLHVNYHDEYNDSDLSKTSPVPTNVGDTISLPTDGLKDLGYELAPGQSTVYKVASGKDTVVVDVVPTPKVVPVKFVDKDNPQTQVGNINYQTEALFTSKSSDTVELPDAPAGYHYDSALQNHQISLNDVSDQHPDQLKIVKIPVVGNQMTVPVQYYDQEGHVYQTGTNDHPAITGQIGQTIQIPSQQKINGVLCTVNGDPVDANNKPLPINYTLTPDNINQADQSDMNMLTYFTHPEDQQNEIIIDAQEYTNTTHAGKRNRLIASDTIPVQLGSNHHVGDIIHIYPTANTANDKDPKDYYVEDPEGFTAPYHLQDGKNTASLELGNVPGRSDVKISNQPYTLKFTDSGLETMSDQPISEIKWNYVAKSMNAFQFKYYDPSDSTNDFGGLHQIHGNMDSYVNVTNPDHGGVPVPNGYHLAERAQTVYQITRKLIDGGRTVENVEIHKNHVANAKGLNYGLSVVYETPAGKEMYSDFVDVPVPSKTPVGHSYTINLNTALANGMQMSDYTLDTSDKKGLNKAADLDPGKSTITVTNQNGKALNKNGGTVYYKAKMMPQSVKVEYINQDNNIVSSDTRSDFIPNTYAGETFSDISDIIDNVSVPKGYTPNSDQNVTVTVGSKDPNGADPNKFTNSANPYIVKIYVEGNPVTTVAPVRIIHTSNIYNDQSYLNSDFGVSPVIELPISGRVGDQLTINANSFKNYLPVGYHFANSANSVNDQQNDPYKGYNYSDIGFTGKLTASDSEPNPNMPGLDNWDPKTWMYCQALTDPGKTYKPTDANSPYWTSNGTPLLVLQADDNKAMNFDLFDTHNNLIKQVQINRNSPVMKQNSQGQWLPDLTKNASGQYAHTYDPSYNDKIDVLKYKSLIPSGYVYDPVRNGSEYQYFGLEPKDIAIYIAGKPVTVNVNYQKPKTVAGGGTYTYADNPSSSDLVKDISYDNQNGNPQLRVGDTITVPLNNLPSGYHLSDGQTKQLTVPSAAAASGSYTDDLHIVPNSEIVPVLYEDQSDNVIGEDNSIVGYINKPITFSATEQQGTQLLSDIPEGYHLADKGNVMTDQMSPSDINAEHLDQMNPITMHVVGDPVKVKVSYVDPQGHTEGSYTKPANVGDTIALPTSDDPLDVTQPDTGYTIANSDTSKTITPSDYLDVKNRAQEITQLGATEDPVIDVKVPVVGNPVTRQLNVNVVYQTASGRTVDSGSVPVNVTGPYDGVTYFDPADLASPAGYTLQPDTPGNGNRTGKATLDYKVNMNSDAVPNQPNSNPKWAEGQAPTIYFKGGRADNQQMIINRVVRSPKGTVINVDQVHVIVGGNVGESDTLKPDSTVTVPFTTQDGKHTTQQMSLVPQSSNGTNDTVAPVISGQADPTKDQNDPITVQILKSNGVTYLSRPMDTFYYTDPNARSTVTVHYVDQNGNYVYNKTSGDHPQPIMPVVSDVVGGTKDLSSDPDVTTKDLPSGYTYSQPKDEVTFGLNDRDVAVGVTGKSASVTVDYVDNGKVLGSQTLSGKVGDTESLNGTVPKGYHLVNGTSDQRLTADDIGGKTIKLPIAPSQLTLPIQFAYENDRNDIVGQASLPVDLDHKTGKISDSLLPKGYHFNGNPTYTINSDQVTNSDTTLLPSQTVPVYGDKATVTVNYINQNGQPVDHQVINNAIGHTVSLPSFLHGNDAHSGYDVKDNSYTFTPYNIAKVVTNGNDQMNSDNVYVNGTLDTGTLTVNTVLENNAGQTVLHSESSRQVEVNAINGNSGTFYPSDLGTPKGYQLDRGASRTAASDQFTDNGGSISWTNGTPTIYFKAGTVSGKLDVTQIKETSDGQILGTSDVQIPMNAVGIGSDASVNVSDVPVPANYKLDTKAPKKLTVTGSANGLLNAHQFLNYLGDSDTLDLQFRINGQNYNVESDEVAGSYGQSLNAMDYLPDGYRLDRNKNQSKDLIYTFGETAQPIVVYIQPATVSGPSLDVTLNFRDPSGRQFDTKTVTLPINADHSGNFTITPGVSDARSTTTSDTPLADYIKGFYPEQDKSIVGNVGQTNDGVQIKQNPGRTFNYYALPATMPVNFINQNGKYVRSDGSLSSTAVNELVKGYYGQQLDLRNDVSKEYQLPKGYHYVSGNYNATVADQSDPATIMVMGDSVNASDSVSVNIVENDPSGHEQDYYTVQVPVKGLIGNQYTLNASDLTPSGYTPVEANDSASWTLSNQPIKPVTFTYQSTALTASQMKADGEALQPINVEYLADGEPMGDTQIPVKSDDYEGETVNAATNSDVQKYLAANDQGYQVVSNQDAMATFSQSPASVYVNIKRASDDPLTFNAVVVQRFYAPSDWNGSSLNKGAEPFRTVTTPVVESGGVGQQFTLDHSDYDVDGYNMEVINGQSKINGISVDKLTKDQGNQTGTITTSGLINGVVNYDYVAQKTSDPNTKVGPITVDYKDANTGKYVKLDGTLSDNPVKQSVGTGYMGQMVDVLDRTQLPNNYHLAPGQPQLVVFNTSAQNRTLTVLPDAKKSTGKITVTYVDPDENDIQVGQPITVSDYADNSFELSPYETAVPRGYQFAGVSQGSDVNTFNSDDRVGQHITINVRKQISDKIVYKDWSDVYSKNTKGQIPKSDIVGTEPVQGLESSAKAHDDPTMINYAQYTTFVPNGYKFYKVDPSALSQNYVVGNDTPHVIWVRHNRTHIFSTVTVNYVEADSDGNVSSNSKVVPQSVSGRSGDVFDLADFEDQTPQNFKYAGIYSDSKLQDPMTQSDDQFTDQDQTLYVKVVPATPKPQYGTITVHYEDPTRPGHDLVAVTVSGHDQSTFNLAPFEDAAPHGYRFAGLDGTHSIPTRFIAGNGNQQDLYIKLK